jgi:chaperonin GroES
MNITMIKDRVLVQDEKAPEQSSGGIFLPKGQDVKDDYQVCSQSGSGVVVAKGEGATMIDVGDRVFFGNHAGMPVELEGEKYLMMNEADIQAIVGY